jgi:DNA-binding transcriptional ArsR family regulator
MFVFLDMTMTVTGRAMDPAAAARVAHRARAVSDPRRVQILSLLRQTPVTVAELSAELDLRPSRTSLQLSVLRAAGLVRAERRGRCRIYSTDPDVVDHLLEELLPLGPGPARPRIAKGRLPPPGSALQIARTCYDHLAGARAVELAVEMERRGWIVRSAAGFLVTRMGESRLVQRGVDVAMCREAHRKFASSCLDWTERRPHVGGAIGKELLRSLESAGYLVRGEDRSVDIRRPILGWLR